MTDEFPIEFSATLDWGVAAASYPGERVSGDSYIVCPTSEGVLLAIVDGLGHGEPAAEAAAIAVATIEAYAAEPPIEIVERCHRALAGTRGVVMGLARIEPAHRRLTWLCVGSIQGIILRAEPEPVPRRRLLLARAGVIGLRIPPLMDGLFEFDPGDELVIATDGVLPEFVDHVAPGPPQALAHRILEHHRRETDDALVVVGRFRGEAPP